MGDSGEARESRGGELSDASKEIEKLIHLCEEVGVVKVSTVYFLWLGFCT